MKAQIISMDFIMTFVVYIFALSVFLFALQDNLSYSDNVLDTQADLLFNRLGQLNYSIDFLDNSKIDNSKFSLFTSEYNFDRAYSEIFKDFDNPAFIRTDYCIYLENKRGEIIRNVAAGKLQGYLVFFGQTRCGNNPTLIYEEQPECNMSVKTDSLVLTKPVLYQGEITNLKILICAEKK